MFNRVRWIRRGLSLLLVSTVAAPLAAQRPGALVGQVRSEEEGTPIVGAMVTLDIGRRTTTDAEGRFRLDDLPAGAYRIAAIAPGCHVGMGTVEAVAGRELSLDVVVPLPAEADPLLAKWGPGERSSGNAVRTMSGDEIRERHFRSVADVLRALAPDMVGQESSEPGGRQTLRPRGSPTVMGPREPLVVVDGVRVTQNPVDALGTMNTSDIERISVAKGASAGWNYGMQGANGVIVITTRTAEGEYAPSTPPDQCGFVFPR